jgi:hypothetical protein
LTTNVFARLTTTGPGTATTTHPTQHHSLSLARCFYLSQGPFKASHLRNVNNDNFILFDTSQPISKLKSANQLINQSINQSINQQSIALVPVYAAHAALLEIAPRDMRSELGLAAVRL